MSESGVESEQGPEEDVLCFKQRTEKSTGGDIILMEWSPTIDLLASALADHSVRYVDNPTLNIILITVATAIIAMDNLMLVSRL